MGLSGLVSSPSGVWGGTVVVWSFSASGLSGVWEFYPFASPKCSKASNEEYLAQTMMEIFYIGTEYPTDIGTWTPAVHGFNVLHIL